jgi:ribosomal protein L7/L12/membrane protein implicated in regulation of membrane protease activity
MAKHVKRSELLESGYAAGLTLLIRATFIVALCLIAYWVFQFWNLLQLAYLMLFGVVVGLAVAAMGAKRMFDAREAPSESIQCPYCDKDVQIVGGLREDFHCDHCERLVHVKDGELVPVREVTCPACRAEHRVAITVRSYTCTNCNRTISLADPDKPEAIVAEDSDVMRNYDVLLTQPGRREAEVAMALQSILVCNLPDARKQMQSLPLIIMRNIPERKADAVRARFRELGAVVAVRPTQDTEVTQPRS